MFLWFSFVGRGWVEKSSYMRLEKNDIGSEPATVQKEGWRLRRVSVSPAWHIKTDPHFSFFQKHGCNDTRCLKMLWGKKKHNFFFGKSTHKVNRDGEKNRYLKFSLSPKAFETHNTLSEQSKSII